MVVSRGELSRRGKSKSPSLTDSFAPFWSFRKGPAGGRSPSEMLAEYFLLNKSDFYLRCCPPCRGRSFLLVQKGTKDTPERGDSDFPPLWTLPLETANTGGSCGSPLLDVPPKSSIATLLAPSAYFVTPPAHGGQGTAGGRPQAAPAKNFTKSLSSTARPVWYNGP